MNRSAALLAGLVAVVAVAFVVTQFQLDFKSTPISAKYAFRTATNKEALVVDQSSVPSSTRGCKKTLWMVAPIIQDASSDRFTMGALSSAIANAPSLVPVVVHYRPYHELPSYITDLSGVYFVQHNISFYSELKMRGELAVMGVYYRLDSAALFPKILALVANRTDIDTSHLLYTDTDVLFFRDVILCNVEQPPFIGMVQDLILTFWRPKYWSKEPNFNSGVMYMNIPAVISRFPQMMEYALTNNRFAANDDQRLINEFFCVEMKGCIHLPLGYNWRLWFGSSVRDYWMKLHTPIIVHFHASKPISCLRCLLSFRHNSDFCVKIKACNPVYFARFGLATDGHLFYEEAVIAHYRYAFNPGYFA